MMVLVLTACPAGLRGFVTRWLLEISPGVFVGKVSARVREAIWARVEDLCQDGRAILVHTARNEQGFDFKVHRHDWEVVDLEGLKLMRRPRTPDRASSGMRSGWSNAAKRRRWGR
ncbi:type I-E CRISPR-associated endoribonuclease Cas2e [Propionibacterium freudenreichii]|uniref:CRISPR-associated protein Cas2 n=1 Tax=Propionibacterium freudenreichii subsp. freudenreichii TaxID=66712 RepID=A0A0B7P181_PROFF|nr:type I-E CRISPR-associated endoribonuclease Cas2e [Propionibacterium freudenreichii]CEP27844.1 CRISPR-associated protein Cas2 [Propionibacterium freudenreichii subsp. freudenreichii]MCT2974160.1 type I-E CRISPR-associated endoribonuclease Cas2 [Propionibacterium freudenreichii]MCT2978010.1 type I-E CRISPR-associated endoribonuclease Cas2 [Propionibacterium freudenreichii]MCT2981429.1 type I-E CRISPR-associated endoribonuclease Cas2 [Propionibacterium freudenreichii]MCT2983924.1 type I-E CRI